MLFQVMAGPFVEMSFKFEETSCIPQCYRNFGCSRPWGIFEDFNHIISNVGYIAYGAAFILMVKSQCHSESINYIKWIIGFPQVSDASKKKHKAKRLRQQLWACPTVWDLLHYGLLYADAGISQFQGTQNFHFLAGHFQLHLPYLSQQHQPTVWHHNDVCHADFGLCEGLPV